MLSPQQDASLALIIHGFSLEAYFGMQRIVGKKENLSLNQVTTPVCKPAKNETKAPCRVQGLCEQNGAQSSAARGALCGHWGFHNGTGMSSTAPATDTRKPKHTQEPFLIPNVCQQGKKAAFFYD